LCIQLINFITILYNWTVYATPNLSSCDTNWMCKIVNL
jgi:hypothetical protein